MQGGAVRRVRRTCHKPGCTQHITNKKGTDVRGDACVDSAVLGAEQHEMIFVDCRPCAICDMDYLSVITDRSLCEVDIPIPLYSSEN